MIIACINCDKKFNVNSELIPNEGRTIQCGSCNHVWFFKKSDQDKKDFKKSLQDNDDIFKTTEKKTKLTKKNKQYKDTKKTNEITNSKSSEIVKYQPKSRFTIVNFLSYFLVVIISFVGLIIVLDTFKSFLYNFFPNLEFFLFSLYEILKDIQLFIKDLFI